MEAHNQLEWHIQFCCNNRAPCNFESTTDRSRAIFQFPDLVNPAFKIQIHEHIRTHDLNLCSMTVPTPRGRQYHYQFLGSTIANCLLLLLVQRGDNNSTRRNANRKLSSSATRLMSYFRARLLRPAADPKTSSRKTSWNQSLHTYGHRSHDSQLDAHLFHVTSFTVNKPQFCADPFLCSSPTDLRGQAL
uniref:Uncharacterized protein n=1 Tax=Steinernema glaseri TaxID=37863 RepID=A0A1I7YCH8_9BILA